MQYLFGSNQYFHPQSLSLFTTRHHGFYYMNMTSYDLHEFHTQWLQRSIYEDERMKNLSYLKAGSFRGADPNARIARVLVGGRAAGCLGMELFGFKLSK